MKPRKECDKKGRTETETRKVNSCFSGKEDQYNFYAFHLIPGTVKSTKRFPLLLILPSPSKLIINQKKNSFIKIKKIIGESESTALVKGFNESSYLFRVYYNNQFKLIKQKIFKGD